MPDLPTPTESLDIVDGFDHWLMDMRWSLGRSRGIFSKAPADKIMERSEGKYSCLPELNVRAMIFRQSFLGIERWKLLVEVGPAVPETAHLWAAPGLEVPG
jgi:hypothetical protein